VIGSLEDQINGVENMMYMTSSASNNGSAEISIYFKQGTDGYWVIGKDSKPNIPSMTIKMEITVESTGRFINLSNFTVNKSI